MERDSKQVLTELLVYRAQGGEEAAFAELYEIWQADFLRFARSVLKSGEGAEDVSQEAWIGVARGIGRLEDPARFRGWAFCLLRRRCVDWIRKLERERKRMAAVGEAQVVEQEKGQEGSREETAVLAELIHELDTDSRMLVQLYYEVGLSVSELAEALGLREGTVKSRLYAVRETLKSKLERKLG